MKKSDFYFDLPPELIAQEPLNDRSASRLLVLDKQTGALAHQTFKDILQYFQPGDVLAVNNTKVIPARLFGKKQTGGKIEVLLLKRIDTTCWECLIKPAKRLKIGETVYFHDSLQAKVTAVLEDGNRLVEFIYEGVFENILESLGQMPLPPYITKKLADKNRYQTVYAKHDGSAAAPTAGLHFTEALLNALREKGVQIVPLTLHVGLGTFRPVKEDDVLQHKMHEEYYVLEDSQAEIINAAKKRGNKIYAVGTTSCRTLESIADETGFVKGASGWTSIFIYPGYRFKIIDGLITNFHLPESTLVMLVAALCGRENILNAYNVAIQEQYRFFSFGDAMLIH